LRDSALGVGQPRPGDLRISIGRCEVAFPTGAGAHAAPGASGRRDHCWLPRHCPQVRPFALEETGEKPFLRRCLPEIWVDRFGREYEAQRKELNWQAV